MLDMEVLAEELAAIVGEQVERAIAPLRAENAELTARLRALESGGFDLSAVKQLVVEAVAEIPAPRDGTSVTLDDVLPLIAGEVERAVGALPAPRDGTSVTIDDVRPLLDAAIEALPAPKDGTSITLDDVAPLIAGEVERAVAALPTPKDGVGLAGALIDRKGSLMLTLSDGSLSDLGRVEGRNGEPGLGFDDMSIEQTGERGFVIRFVRGEQAKEFSFTMPVMIDRGVYRTGESYEKGDCVTFGGSLWIAQQKTSEKPDGANTGWRLGVKRGRDGRDVEPR